MDDASLGRAVDHALQEVLAAAGRVLPAAADAALQLDSLMVVALVDALETQLPVRLRPQDVTATHFASRQSLQRLCRALLPRD